MRYGRDLGCKWGLSHDLEILHDGKAAKWEQCKICRKRFRWTKGSRGRVHNAEYLKAHIRNFCQRYGATKMIYHKIYKSNEMIIRI